MKKQSKTNWERVDAMADRDIDYSDNSPLAPAFFDKAVRWPGNKELISLRLDPDVLTFFRRQGKGYQTTMNMLLRKYMEAQTGGVPKRAASSLNHQVGRSRARSGRKK